MDRTPPSNRRQLFGDGGYVSSLCGPGLSKGYEVITVYLDRSDNCFANSHGREAENHGSLWRERGNHAAGTAGLRHNAPRPFFMEKGRADSAEGEPCG